MRTHNIFWGHWYLLLCTVKQHQTGTLAHWTKSAHSIILFFLLFHNFHQLSPTYPHAMVNLQTNYLPIHIFRKWEKTRVISKMYCQRKWPRCDIIFKRSMFSLIILNLVHAFEMVSVQIALKKYWLGKTKWPHTHYWNTPLLEVNAANTMNLKKKY